MYNWTHIIIHHSLTKDSKTVSWSAIKNYHVNTNGWSDIGYHFGIEKINDEYEILAGRPLNKSGAHTRGMNDKAIGICCVGNYDKINPPSALIKKLAQFIAGLCVSLDIEVKNIKGHRDFSNKSCPGNKFDLGFLVNMVNINM